MASARKKRKKARTGGAALPKRILAVDIGGSKIKILLSDESEPRKAVSGQNLTPQAMVEKVRKLASGWKYDAISIGYPGLVGADGPRSEPGLLAPGWVGFNFAAAFECPVRIINDAAMQALGSYHGGRMLFLGLGTGLGSALIFENVIVPLELGQLAHSKNKSFGDMLGRRGFSKLGKKAWRKEVAAAVSGFTAVFRVDYVVLGGGNARYVKKPPPGAQLGHNLTAFRGGFRLWDLADVETLSAHGARASNTDVRRPRWRAL